MSLLGAMAASNSELRFLTCAWHIWTPNAGGIHLLEIVLCNQRDIK